MISPGLNSRLIIRFGQSLGFCASTPSRVELWSNLTVDQSWHAFPFLTCGPDKHTLTISTADLPEGDYEFTARSWDSASHQWHWYGTTDNNGHVYIRPYGPSIQPEELAQLELVTQKQYVQTQLHHYRVPLGTTHVGSIETQLHSYVAFARKSSCWMTPIPGADRLQPDQQKWQLLLFQDRRHGNIHAWIAVSMPTVDHWMISHGDNTLSLNCENGQGHLIVASTTEQNVSGLMRDCTQYISDHIVQCKPDGSNKTPDSATASYLGYCTWNAFGQGVSFNDISTALDELTRIHVPIRYLVIDDGWQCHTNRQLLSMEADSERFPLGLQKSVSLLKKRFPGLLTVGVWHTLWGYWQGVHESLAAPYGHVDVDSVGLVDHPHCFYEDFYKFLTQAGIQMMKVDNQGAFQDLNLPFEQKQAHWNKYLDAMAQTIEKYALSTNIVHCMAFTPHILFHPTCKVPRVIFRNSDDYFPDVSDSHPWHIYVNAMNSLWTNALDLTADWDMFQSRHPFAEYHAISRAISGGPVYITDIPGYHDTSILSRLVATSVDGEQTLLRYQQQAQPSFDTVFHNPMQPPYRCIELSNQHRDHSDQCYAVVGFWNPSDTRQFSHLSHHGSAPNQEFIVNVVAGHDKGTVTKLHIDANTIGVTVAPLGCTMLSLCPIATLPHLSLSTACLGLVDKYNGICAIQSSQLLSVTETKAEFRVLLTHKSQQCGFWIDLPWSCTRVDFGGQIAPTDSWVWDNALRVLLIDMTSCSASATPSGSLFFVTLSLTKEVLL
ncbi:glycoside hydrolase superfamily [Radiomyces spectabilis]|uniref:glycoside hydrolase superfamily n=1 Tax=Radiomyces spectabilis TaxID=64574 RepID=UPI002220550D|nr:glycoside hydrolase superfamily [Radiomyces spectabilis]KAI8374754.1 glycoside hydrolase superfamily [Radiomyces spectabilis]